ncbi:expressed unknown protein [Seminavis robusta]|uniref:Uncharacterized protein n=1 Tax=Seminavis robusta TaxID=568900 RepID=A0A9N8DQC8_9STRA|nr:expressed unknown protein [Seminavis robusta]|eukprot:Sro209_g087320.1 n/a (1180) ;mRNA; r:31033-35905
MAASFEQLVGAAADVRELEYVSALHQTDLEEVRKDASIRAEDIRLFLSSRYGIMVDDEKVRKTILNGLGGCDADAEDDDGVLDLMEVVAMLLIPIFLKAADTDTQELTEEEFLAGMVVDTDQLQMSMHSIHKQMKRTDGLVPTPAGMMDYVLKMILHDVTGDSKAKPLTPDLIRRILAAYGEVNLAADSGLVQEMYHAAMGMEETANNSEDDDEQQQPTKNDNNTPDKNTSNPPMLNVLSFAEALTHDVRLYDIRNEARLTTNFDDVYFTDAELKEREEEATTHAGSPSELWRVKVDAQSLRDKLAVSEELDRVNTFPAIDITAGTYRSKGLMVMLFSTIMITYFAYFIDFNRNIEETCNEEEGVAYEWNSPWTENADAMFCEAFVSVANWLVFFAGMSIFGVINVSMGSVGNSVNSNSGWKSLIGFTWVLLLVTIPLVGSRNNRKENNVLYAASLIFGLITCVFHLSNAFALSFATDCFEKLRQSFPQNPILKSSISEEQAVKQATAMKLSRMTKNALEICTSKDLDSILNSHYGQALKQYETEGKKFKRAGGFIWCWRQLFGTNQIFQKHGIWVPARMISSNLAQYVVTFYVLFGGIFLTLHVAEEYDIEWAKRQVDHYINRAFEVDPQGEAVETAIANMTPLVSNYLKTLDASSGIDFGCSNASLAPAEDLFNKYCPGTGNMSLCDFKGTDVSYLCPLVESAQSGSLNATSQLALLNASGFEGDIWRTTAYNAAQGAANEGVDSLYPSEKYMITAPLYLGTIIAFFTALSLAVVFIPSVVTTILRLRSGDIATLRNKDFNRYRHAPDQVALLTGSLFWGSLFSSVLVGGAFGLVLFFFLWQASAYYAQRLVAILCGIISVALVRLAFVCTCRCTMYKSFYRTKPGPANISILALEWGNFALSAGYILVRALKLLLASATFIGRVDTPFLAHNVGRIGPLELDNYPVVHMKEVLSHEAHRHPYIEQLGVIYLMKLRYANHFGKRAGTCWRLIFVYALMPWLQKYRILAREEDASATAENIEDLEEQFPDLNFANVDTSARGLRSSIMRSSVNEDDKRRIMELEAEVQRLREELAKVNEAPSVVVASEPNSDDSEPEAAAAIAGNEHSPLLGTLTVDEPASSTSDGPHVTFEESSPSHVQPPSQFLAPDDQKSQPPSQFLAPGDQILSEISERTEVSC